LKRISPGGALNLARFKKIRQLASSAWATTESAGRLQVSDLPPAVAAHEGRELAVLSANLWHDWPRFRNVADRLERFARLVEQEQVDLVLLQEVSRTRSLHADEWLAARLGMAVAYSRANGHPAIGFEEGPALLSRFPLQRVCLHQFAYRWNPFSRRLALGAAVETPGGWLHAFSVHLGLLRRQNAIQVRSLVDWVTQMAAEDPALVGGDFNAHETSAQISAARQRWLDTFRSLHPHADGTTHTLSWLRGSIALPRRLDYIFLHAGESHWRVRETRHLDAPGGPHSDHKAVLTRLVFC
jgi:endonuclease/exonuclease/phosphatase family metal-dependent hydrolase